MKKFSGYGTTRFIRTGPVKSGVTVQNAALPNFILCHDCNRMIPRREYDWHKSQAHKPAPPAVEYICPNCGGEDLVCMPDSEYCPTCQWVGVLSEM